MTLFQGNRALLEAFRRGEEHALRTVYAHYIKVVGQFIGNGWYNPDKKKRVYGVLDFDIQAELIQDIFMQAFLEKTRLSYDGIRPYKGFLLGIGRNVILKYIRNRPKDALYHVSVELDKDDIDADREAFFRTLAKDAVSAEVDVDWHRCAAATTAYIDTLAPVLKEFVALRFQKRLPLVETARKLNITRGKARFLEKDLARRLRRHLQGLNLRVEFLK